MSEQAKVGGSSHHPSKNSTDNEGKVGGICNRIPARTPAGAGLIIIENPDKVSLAVCC